MFWAWPACRPLAEQSGPAEQLSEPSYSPCLCDWVMERRASRKVEKTLPKEVKTPKEAEKQGVGGREKKRRKMENGMNGALTSYLTRRSAPPSSFHFVISALASMSSLNDHSAIGSLYIFRDRPLSDDTSKKESKYSNLPLCMSCFHMTEYDETFVN